MTVGAERHRVRQPQLAALARCTQRLQAPQEALQPLDAREVAGVFTRMMEGLAAVGAERKPVIIDATYLAPAPVASSHIAMTLTSVGCGYSGSL